MSQWLRKYFRTEKSKKIPVLNQLQVLIEIYTRKSEKLILDIESSKKNGKIQRNFSKKKMNLQIARNTINRFISFYIIENLFHINKCMPKIVIVRVPSRKNFFQVN